MSKEPVEIELQERLLDKDSGSYGPTDRKPFGAKWLAYPCIHSGNSSTMIT